MDLRKAVRCGKQGGFLALNGTVFIKKKDPNGIAIEELQACAHWGLSCTDCDEHNIRELKNTKKTRTLTED